MCVMPWRLATTFAALLASSGVGHAAPVLYYGFLNGLEDIPPSTANGVTSITADATAHTLHVTVSFSGLLGLTTAAHIHCCTTPPGTTAVATTTPSFVGFPLSVTSGTYDNTLDLTLASSYNPSYVTNNGGAIASAETALLAGIVAGQAYLNIHTTTYPGGEIRAFLIPDLIFRSGMEAP
jgi:hypothetical protein